MECWCNNCPHIEMMSFLQNWQHQEPHNAFSWSKLSVVVVCLAEIEAGCLCQHKFWSNKYIHYCSHTTWTTSHPNESALSECIVWNEGARSITVKTRQYTHSETGSTSVENAQTNDPPTGLSLNNLSRSGSSRNGCWALSLKCSIDNSSCNRFRLITEPNSGVLYKGFFDQYWAINGFFSMPIISKSPRNFSVSILSVLFQSRIRKRGPTMQGGSNRKE